MSDQHLDRVKTSITSLNLYGAIGRAWPLVVGGTPSRDSLLVLLAQSAFETGEWQAAFNFNLGNVKHVSGDGFDFFTMNCTENLNGQDVQLQGCMFRSYPSLDEGAQSYLTTLSHRFKNAWGSVEAGDPSGFVHKLKQSGYFTGNETDYTNGVLAYFHKFDAQLPQSVPLPVAGGRFLELATISIVGLAVGGISYVAWKSLKPRRRRATA